MEKKSCWFYGSGQEEKLSVLLLFCGDRVEKLWDIVIGKAVGELCPSQVDYKQLSRLAVSPCQCTWRLSLLIDNNV